MSCDSMLVYMQCLFEASAGLFVFPAGTFDCSRDGKLLAGKAVRSDGALIAAIQNSRKQPLLQVPKSRYYRIRAPTTENASARKLKLTPARRFCSSLLRFPRRNYPTLRPQAVFENRI